MAKTAQNQTSIFPDVCAPREKTLSEQVCDMYIISNLRRKIADKGYRRELKLGDADVRVLNNLTKEYLRKQKGLELLGAYLIGQIKEAIARDESECDSPYEKRRTINLLESALGVVESLLNLS